MSFSPEFPLGVSSDEALREYQSLIYIFLPVSAFLPTIIWLMVVPVVDARYALYATADVLNTAVPLGRRYIRAENQIIQLSV